MTTRTTPAIRVQGLEKSYDELQVLRGVDFDVARGKIFALLGSNGAGKTTVVKILSTLLRADAGTATVDGYDVGERPDGAGAFAYPIFFLPFISSAFVPTETMPGPVQTFAEHQPVTSIVDTLRNLFEQQPVGNDLWAALAWCLGILAVAYALAMAACRRRIA